MEIQQITVNKKYLAIILLLVFSLSFAAGGGGSSSSPIPLAAIATTYSCDNNLLIVTITSSLDSSVISEADVRVLDPNTGTIFASTTSDSNGQMNATITDNGKYLVSSSKSGYRSNSAFVFINCQKANGLETVTNASSNKTTGAIIQKEPEFYCTEGRTIRERVKCYLTLSVDKIENIRYIPEECNVPNETEKNSCIVLYRKLQTCRVEEFETDKERETCIRPKIALKNDLKDEVKDCKDMQNTSDRKACVVNLKEKVFTLVKFRMYNLVYKAEELSLQGIDSEAVTDFVVYLNQAKIRFNSAVTIKEKKEIVKEVIIEWKKFKSLAKVNRSS
ncbi:MAG: carboxypeptidase-like regulatory domain-containing protein [Candidatus Micrarchaeota archaeon]